MTSPSSHFITIPNLVIIARFTCKKPLDCITLSLVNRIFRETMVDFHAAQTIFATMLTGEDPRLSTLVQTLLIRHICQMKHKSNVNCFTWVVHELLDDYDTKLLFVNPNPSQSKFNLPLFAAISSSQPLIVEAILNHVYEKLKEAIAAEDSSSMLEVEERIRNQTEGRIDEQTTKLLHEACAIANVETLSVIFDYLEKFYELEMKSVGNHHTPNRVVEFLNQSDSRGWFLIFHALRNIEKLKLVITRAKKHGCIIEQFKKSTPIGDTILNIMATTPSFILSPASQKEVCELIFEEMKDLQDGNLLKYQLQFAPVFSSELVSYLPVLKAASASNAVILKLFLDKADELGILRSQIEEAKNLRKTTMLMFSVCCPSQADDLFSIVLPKLEKLDLVKEQLLKRNDDGMTVLHFAVEYNKADSVRAIIERAKQFGILDTLLRSTTNYAGQTPFHIGVSRRGSDFTKVIRILADSFDSEAELKEYICNFNGGGSAGGTTVLDCAKANKNITAAAAWLVKKMES